MKRYKINRNEECLCGSGLKFKYCCLPYLDDSVNVNRIIEEIDKNNYELALKYCRADLTKYLWNVKSHTESLLIANSSLGNMLLEIDIKALSELLDRLMLIINRGDLKVDFIYALNRIGDVFYNQRWHMRLVYYKAAWKFFIEDNEDDARIIALEVSYKDIDDLDFLQMYYDLCYRNLSFSQKQEVLGKLVNLEETYSGKIQYLGAKGLEYFLIGDKSKAKEIFSKVIELAENNFDKFIGPYDYHQLGQAYLYAGRLLTKKEYLEKSIEYFTKSSEIEPMTDLGYSMTHSNIGDIYCDLNDLDKGLEHYFKSLDYFDNALTKIFIAQVYLEKSELEKAQEYLDQIKFEDLSYDNKVDYLFVISKFIVLHRDNEKAEFVCNELKKLRFDNKYFSDLTNQLITELLEVYGNFSENTAFEKSKVKKLLSKINEYFILQPNFAGIGFNFNNLIKDIIDRKKPAK